MESYATIVYVISDEVLRLDQRKGFLEHKYIGYAASKKRYFCGIKVHMVVTNQGRPIEVQLKVLAEVWVTIRV